MKIEAILKEAERKGLDINLSAVLRARFQELQDVSDEVIKIWNEDGEGGEIQMKTPIAWYRAINKAEKIQNNGKDFR